MYKLSTKSLKFAFLGVFLTLAPAAPVLAFAPSTQPISSRPMFFIRHGNGTSSASAALTQSSSENWSGYAATGTNGEFTSVTSSWVQPTLTCAAKSTNYSAYWVGLDGYSDNSVEQIGTEANCINGSPQYYTWYEMYPQNPSEVLTSLPATVGNSFTATVTYNPPVVTTHGRFRSTNPGSYTLTLTDNTTKASYSTTQTSNRTFYRDSAEVIAEAPYSNGILPLSDFGTLNFTGSKVNGSALSVAAGLQSITMDDPYGMVSTPSALDVTGENFTVTWSS